MTSDAGVLLVYEFMSKVQFKSLFTTDSPVYCRLSLCRWINNWAILTKLLSKSALASQTTLSRVTHRLNSETINQLWGVNQPVFRPMLSNRISWLFYFDMGHLHTKWYPPMVGNEFNGNSFLLMNILWQMIYFFELSITKREVSPFLIVSKKLNRILSSKKKKLWIRL